MAAMTLERKTKKYGELTVPNLLVLPIKGKTKVLLGSVVVLNAGFITPATEATGIIACGIAEETIDNTLGLDGEILVPIRQGVFLLFAGSGTDALAQVDVGKDVYLLDDQTVTKTDGGGKRSRAGKLIAVEPDGMVWVQIALGL